MVKVKEDDLPTTFFFYLFQTRAQSTYLVFNNLMFKILTPEKETTNLEDKIKF